MLRKYNNCIAAAVHAPPEQDIAKDDQPDGVPEYELSFGYFDIDLF